MSFLAPVVAAWKLFLEGEKFCADEKGFPLIQQLLEFVGPIKDALRANDQDRTILIFDKCDTIARKLLPHIRCEAIRQIHAKQIDNCQKLIDNMRQTEHSHSDALNNFLRGTYTLLSSNSKSILTSTGDYHPGIEYVLLFWK